MYLPKTTISTLGLRPTYTCIHLSNYWHVHVGLPWTYMNLVLPEGAQKLGGREGMQSKGHICTCPVLLHCFGDICQQVFGLFLRMTQHLIYSQVYVIMNGSVWLGGGGRNCCQRGGISYAMGEGGGAAGPHPQGYA